MPLNHSKYTCVTFTISDDVSKFMDDKTFNCVSLNSNLLWFFFIKRLLCELFSNFLNKRHDMMKLLTCGFAINFLHEIMHADGKCLMRYI